MADLPRIWIFTFFGHRILTVPLPFCVNLSDENDRLNCKLWSKCLLGSDLVKKRLLICNTPTFCVSVAVNSNPAEVMKERSVFHTFCVVTSAKAFDTGKIENAMTKHAVVRNVLI